MGEQFCAPILNLSKTGLVKNMDLKFRSIFCDSKIRVRWYIGMPSACYAADPGSNPGGVRNDYANRSFS